jgi:hypothetical protein
VAWVPHTANVIRLGSDGLLQDQRWSAASMIVPWRAMEPLEARLAREGLTHKAKKSDTEVTAKNNEESQECEAECA